MCLKSKYINNIKITHKNLTNNNFKPFSLKSIFYTYTFSNLYAR